MEFIEQIVDIFSENLPLIEASKRGNFKLVQFLMEYDVRDGIDIALEVAIKINKPAIVQFLFENGASICSQFTGAVHIDGRRARKDFNGFIENICKPFSSVE